MPRNGKKNSFWRQPYWIWDNPIHRNPFAPIVTTETGYLATSCAFIPITKTNRWHSVYSSKSSRLESLQFKLELQCVYTQVDGNQQYLFPSISHLWIFFGSKTMKMSPFPVSVYSLAMSLFDNCNRSTVATFFSFAYVESAWQISQRKLFYPSIGTSLNISCLHTV